jgi:chromosomal replication initiator protein DnaA
LGFIDWLFGSPKQKKKSKTRQIKDDDDWRRKEEEWKKREDMWKDKEEKIRKMQERIIKMEEKRRKIEGDRKNIELAIQKEKEKKVEKDFKKRIEKLKEQEIKLKQKKAQKRRKDFEKNLLEEHELVETSKSEVEEEEEFEEIEDYEEEEEEEKPRRGRARRRPRDEDEYDDESEVEWAEEPKKRRRMARRSASARAKISGVLPELSFETFVVGENNRFPYVAAQSVAQAPARAYNPLFIWGDVGLGKTHLLHSIAIFITERDPDARIVYCSSERFTNELIRAVETGTLSDFRDKYRNIDVLLIDDIQFISGKENTQEEFFHTFNDLYNNSKQIVISSDRPPSEIRALEKRLRSRFEGGLITQVKAPSEDMRVAILRAKVKDMNVYIPEDVVRHIASLITSNVRELQGALNRVKAFASMTGAPVTMENAKKALEDMKPSAAMRETEPVREEEVPAIHEMTESGLTVGSASDMDLIRQLEKDAGADHVVEGEGDFDMETKKMEEDLMKELKRQGVDFK